MTSKEFKNITSVFPDIKNLLNQSDKLNNEKKKVRRKLNSLNNKYDFLNTIIGKDIFSTPLEKALQKFLKEIGYSDVRWLGHNNEYEDLQICTGDRITVIEVKGLATPHPKEHDCHQVNKYVLRRHALHPNKRVFGIFVTNHDNSISDFKKRNPTPFDKLRVKDAELSKYGITTTIQLFNAFIKFKTGQLTFNDFDKKLHSIGLIKFDSGN